MPPKILLVDDREDNLMSIEAILGTDGYTFVKANSGRQALKILLTEFDFALIVQSYEKIVNYEILIQVSKNSLMKTNQNEKGSESLNMV